MSFASAIFDRVVWGQRRIRRASSQAMIRPIRTPCPGTRNAQVSEVLGRGLVCERKMSDSE
jgi:hypothetical protein